LFDRFRRVAELGYFAVDAVLLEESTSFQSPQEFEPGSLSEVPMDLTPCQFCSCCRGWSVRNPGYGGLHLADSRTSVQAAAIEAAEVWIPGSAFQWKAKHKLEGQT